MESDSAGTRNIQLHMRDVVDFRLQFGSFGRMKSVRASHHSGRQGVHIVGDLVHGELGWLFRDQDEDFGIDAQIEVVKGSCPTGRIIAAQIKAGVSFFSNRNKEGFVFRGKAAHLKYWLGHRLPVIVILCDTRNRVAYWQSVTKDTVTRTGKGWKMTVPLSQVIDKKATDRLEAVAEGPPYFQRLAGLQLARPWMKMLDRGDRLFVEAEEWINKSSGKCSIDLILQDRRGNERRIRRWNYFIFYPGYGFAEGLQFVFPWAKFQNDSETYEDYDEERYQEECGRYDKEEGEMYFLTSYKEWKEGRDLDALRPYDQGMEVASWRLELILNDLGKSFLLTEKYLSGI